MTRLFKTCLAATALACACATAAPPADYAEHTPGNESYSRGLHAWTDGRYFDARHRFERAAWWADKFAQYNLGAMYYRGDGVERQPARAWAWFELSAERGYSQFASTADAVWSELDSGQRDRAQSILAELESEYGDAVAIERTARVMRRRERNQTGSRLGFTGFLKIIEPHDTRDGEDFYSAEKWDFRRVVEMEKNFFDAIARGNVRIGEFEVIEEDPASESGSGRPEGEPDH